MNPNGSATTAYFQWSTDSTFASDLHSTPVQSIGSGNASTQISADLNLLGAGTTYYFRVVASSAGGDITDSPPKSFTTLNAPPSPPTVQTEVADGISITQATLHGSVNPNGSATTTFFQWSTDITFASDLHSTPVQSIGSGNASTPISAALDHLGAGTTYYFRVVAINAGGTITDSPSKSFPTLAIPPAVTTDNATRITENSATLNGTVNPNGLATDYYFQWGPGMDNTPLQSIGAGVLIPQPVSADLIFLSDNTVYSYRLVATNSGGTTIGSDNNFRTLSNPPPTADAGPDQTVFMGHTVTLDGSGSTPASGTITSYQWTQTKGTTVTLSTPDSQTTTFEAPTVNDTGEVLQFQLTVTEDPSGESQSDTVNVTVNWGFLDDFSTAPQVSNTEPAPFGAYLVLPMGAATFTYRPADEDVSVETFNDELFFSMFFDELDTGGVESDRGVFSLSWFPTRPTTGTGIRVAVGLDEQTYYQLSTTDNTVTKVIGNIIVESVAFTPSYSQNLEQTIKVTFTPETTIFEGFGAPVILSANKQRIPVLFFGMQLQMQDAYIDNIRLEAIP